MLDDVIEELQSNFESTLQGLSRELVKLRTGRANLGMLDGIRVEYYGSQAPLNQVATLKVADARLITIQPWEASMIPDIERAISSSELGLNPSNDGVLIRVPIPQLTGERRQQLVKLLKRIGEDHKVSLRNHRRDANDTIKELEKESEITEDEMHRAFDRVDGMTSTYTTKIDGMLDSKEQEILEI